ncbi:MAG TPA: TMEM175 family protein, partial [Candidatus Cybelea sp.]
LGIVLPRANYASNRDLTAALLRLWPNLVAYGLSFGVIGIIWQNHHALFRLVERIDRKTVLLNLLLLAGIAFIPFATSTLGSYPTMRASTFLYGVTLAFCATANNLIVVRLIRIRAFYSEVRDAAVARTARAYCGAWITYSLAALLALFVPIVSFVCYLAIVFYFLIPRGVDSDVVEQESG